MSRMVVIGNAGAGQSTLARLLGRRLGIRHVEIDRYLWQPGWTPTAEPDYERLHQDPVAGPTWIIDGLGRQASIAERMARTTEVILIDMPSWMHFWLAAERQIQWAQGRLENAPAAITEMPPTRAFFETMWHVDRHWMPGIRHLCPDAERAAKPVTRRASVEELDRFAGPVGCSASP